MQKGTILSVDDDLNLQTVISQYLEGDGYKVLTANSAQSALKTIENNLADVILLDLVLPDAEGLTLIPQFQSLSKAGIIIVSGKSDTTEKIVCLEMGADDYITKPFEMRELSARIKAISRRLEHESPEEEKPNGKDQGEILFSKGRLDRDQYQVFDKEGNSLEFTTGEFQLLEVLLMSPNRALSREQLFERTRDGNYEIYDRAIDIQIARIRKKLDDEDGTLIKTVRGVGYMYIPS